MLFATEMSRSKILITSSISISSKLRCANHAFVTAESFSRNAPKYCGLSETTTTAFCTVERVTSAGRLINDAASSCLVHDIPKRDVAGLASVPDRRRVK